MSIFMILRIALKALNRNKMRTALTMLGMIIGVGAVITMVALGTGAQTSIEAQIQSAGTNMIIVSAGNFSAGGVRQGQDDAPGLRPRHVRGLETVERHIDRVGRLERRQLEAAVECGIERRDDAVAAMHLDVRAGQRQARLIDDDAALLLRRQQCRAQRYR